MGLTVRFMQTPRHILRHCVIVVLRHTSKKAETHAFSYGFHRECYFLDCTVVRTYAILKYKTKRQKMIKNNVIYNYVIVISDYI